MLLEKAMCVGMKEVLRTVYEDGSVDAVTWYTPSDVPHLVERLTLRQDDDDADYTEGNEEVNCTFAKSFKCFCDSYEQSSVNCTC
jgi:hypothetical protein